MNIIIPKELAHLKVDSRGYPIPFFVTKVNGVYDFRLLNVERQKEAAERKLCGVCGKKLYRDFIYFISGPLGLKNKVSSDPAMHRVCAEFSLSFCPHMYFEKATRRSEDFVESNFQNQLHNLKKPTEVFLIKAAAKYCFKDEYPQPLFHYKSVSFEKYIYVDGKLKKE